MTLADAALAARPDACSACGGALDPLGRCVKCGAVFGEAYRCPHCQALSDVESSSTLYYRCRACGGPRVPPTESPISEAETALLRSARNDQLRQLAFRAGAGFALASGVLSLLVTSVVLLVVSAGAFAKGAALVASLIPFVLAFLAQQRSRAHAKTLDASLQQAWLLAATRAVRERGTLSAGELARALRIDESRAELLLAEVSVQDFVHSPAEPAARLRITELAEPAELGAPSPDADANANANANDAADRSSASKP